MTLEQTEHYFDWAATSPCDKDILTEALVSTMEKWGNPSSTHAAGKEARDFFENARKRAANVLGVPSEKIYFTSGGTESDHIPLLSVLNRPQKGTVLFSSIEHPAVREQANALKKCGFTVSQIPCGKDGIVTPEAVSDALTPDTLLVCVMAVNNETGAIQPVYRIADAITKKSEGKRRPKFHIDCVQAAGKIPLDISYKGIDSAAFSAHKICGPRGIGILYLADPIEGFLRGGGQEKSIRSGTENVFGAEAFSKCLERYFIRTEKPETITRFEQQKEYARDFIQALSGISACTVIPEARLSNPDNYSPWVVQAAFKNVPGQVMLRALDSKGFYISTGSACSSRKNNRPVLEAMHIPPEISETAVRFSFGPATTKKAIDELLKEVKNIAETFNR